ncbi:MAG: aminodeoxychorismate synthase component I [Burkholderiales bacterium]
MLTELPYFEDSAPLFEAVADSPWAVFLDSGKHHLTQSRYDIIAAEPFMTLVTCGGMTEVRRSGEIKLSPEDPFLLLEDALGAPQASFKNVPFRGGAMGYFGYDLARRFEKLPALAEDREDLPEMAVAIYDWAYVVDHAERRSWLAASGRDPATEAKWKDLIARFTCAAHERFRAPFRLNTSVASNLNFDGYGRAFKRIQSYIHAGDCYQVNLAQRFEARAEGDPWLAFQVLRAINPAPFGAYLNTAHAQILSASPERFLQVRNGEVETKPIKGTRPRAGHPRLDAALAEVLRESEKDRAENLMIVDLLRNDLSKTCDAVHVPKLFDVESFPTVHHLVSTVTGTLRAGKSALDVLRACFPGGSITGAPKLRAMQIIEELEPHRRGVYCGAIGYIGFDGAMDCNIAIRTLVYSNGIVRFWAGGGIVADSRLNDEYRETFDKAAAMLRLLQQGANIHQDNVGY